MLAIFKKLRNHPYILKVVREISPTYRRQEKEWKQTYTGISTLCLFVGSQRTGHTLVGHLLNQHPNVAIANEYYLLKQMRRRGADKIYRLLQQMLYKAQTTKCVDFTGVGGYIYHKLNTKHIGSRPVQVLGDNSAGYTTGELNLTSFDVLQGVDDTQKALKFIFLIRNPYDVISTQVLRMVSSKHPPFPKEYTAQIDDDFHTAFNDCPSLPVSLSTAQIADKLGAKAQYRAQLSAALPQATSTFFELMQVVEELTKRRGQQSLISIHHHKFATEPRQQLRKILNFLDLEEPPGYLDEAVKQVRPSNRSRNLINYVWSDSARAKVTEQMRQFDFLANYSFESD